ncbi:glycosyltransferase family 2 protein [Massilia sp. CT11-108]|uniref:glycosyltransferase family 2 protein n=1 Tax=Massilia sp. CT11-108 TaxID=3393900 RepID=UPI0039A5C6F3
MESNCSNEVRVSVCVVTYNQVGFVQQCLQSILSQVTEYDFEVIIGDDFSTDGTREIIQDMARQYPGKIIPLFHEKNVGATKNYLAVHDLARGKYIAHCDGDDYWLPGKLQYQYSLLEADEDLAFVAETEHKISSRMLLTVDNLLEMANPVMHSSKMYRRESILTRSSDVDLLDFYFNVEHARSGIVLLEKARFTYYRRYVGVSRRLGIRFYALNCEAAYRAYELGASKRSAYAAAKSARLVLIKQAIHEANWEQLDNLLRPSELELMLATTSKRYVLETLAGYRIVRPLIHFALRAKRAMASLGGV